MISSTFENRLSQHSGLSAWVSTGRTGEIERELTLESLDAYIGYVQKFLGELTQAGDRILVENNGGIEFVVVFLATIFCRRVPIPVPVSTPRTEARTRSIIDICHPSLQIIVTGKQDIPSVVDSDCETQLRLPLLDQWRQETNAEHSLSVGSPLFIQFTSGSTGNPKGAPVTLANLEANLRQIERVFDTGKIRHLVNWLPKHHDMGLITSVFLPVWSGFRCVELNPVRVAGRPSLWLQAISDFQAEASGGPSAMYQRCVDTIQDVEGLNLGNWRAAFCGSDFISRDTLHDFSVKFAPAGFRVEALMPCYGMAESTLLISSCPIQEKPKCVSSDQRLVDFDSTNASKRMSTGLICDGEVLIVDEKDQTLDDGLEGEILLHSPSVIEQYYGTDSKSEFFYRDDKRYLRTGDRGYLLANELVVSGRNKEMLSVFGRNVYLVDVDELLKASFTAEIAMAAFFLEEDSVEQIAVCVAKVRNPDAASRAHSEERINAVMTANYGCKPGAIWWSDMRYFPTTPSGKIARHELTKLFHQVSGS
ncbi:MAG: AMP-binding protein [Pseudomonadales bacterium]|nr:AMP-binding protein [Pseudomonadales bacterium]